MLNDIRVVEIGQVLSAPYTGMIFAELGAEVIKIEKPGSGDEARMMGPAFRHGASMNFTDVNRGKRSVVLDLKSEQGVADLFAILVTADVMVHNLRPGEAERMGIGPQTVTAKFPRLVYCGITAFGTRGPRKMQPGYEPLLQAFGGLISMNGSPDGPPARMAASLVDQGTAMWTVIGVLSAIHRRQATGRGAIVDTSLLETAVAWSANRIHSWINEGKPSERYGTAHPGLVPYQAFETADGLLMICAGNDRLFRKMAGAVGHPEWADDPRWTTNRQRLVNRKSLVDAMTEVLRTRPRAHWIERIERVNVPVAPVNSIPEVAADPHVREIGIIGKVAGTDYSLVGMPLSIDGERPNSGKEAPELGADTEGVLRDVRRN